MTPCWRSAVPAWPIGMPSLPASGTAGPPSLWPPAHRVRRRNTWAVAWVGWRLSPWPWRVRKSCAPMFGKFAKPGNGSGWRPPISCRPGNWRGRCEWRPDAVATSVLLLPGPFTDHPSVRHMGRRYYQSLLRHGVRIFEYQPRFSHLKLLLCDDWVSLGSSNADAWNYRWNLEANQEAQDPDLAEQVETMLQEDFARSLEIDLADWLRRPWHRRWPEWFWGRVQALLAWISSQVRPRTGSDEPL